MYRHIFSTLLLSIAAIAVSGCAAVEKAADVVQSGASAVASVAPGAAPIAQVAGRAGQAGAATKQFGLAGEDLAEFQDTLGGGDTSGAVDIDSIVAQDAAASDVFDGHQEKVLKQTAVGKAKVPTEHDHEMFSKMKEKYDVSTSFYRYLQVKGGLASMYYDKNDGDIPPPKKLAKLTAVTLVQQQNQQEEG